MGKCNIQKKVKFLCKTENAEKGAPCFVCGLHRKAPSSLVLSGSFTVCPNELLLHWTFSRAFWGTMLEHSRPWIPAVCYDCITLTVFQDCSFRTLIRSRDFLEHMSNTVRPSGTISIVLLASTSTLFVLWFLTRQGPSPSVGPLLETCHICTCTFIGNHPSAP